MKLFALAATTAVDARSWSRVTHPAPGFINEQGGYWADQPTHPQAPQINEQVHQPYVQKPQCCEGYTWISPIHGQLWMRKSGEHLSKPYYTATDKSGNTRVLFWSVVPGMGNAPPYAIPGNWYLSSSLGVTLGAETVSQQSLGFRRCPQDYQSKPFTGGNDFKCDQGPPQQGQQGQQQCCNTYKWTRPGKADIWVNGNGQTNEGKPVYEGFDKSIGMTITFYWKQRGQSSGEWWYGEDGVNGILGSPTAPLSSGMNSCLEFNGSFDLQCGTPPPAETCEDQVNIPGQSMLNFTKLPSAPWFKVNECKVADMMESLVNLQVQKVIKIAVDKPWPEQKLGSKASTLWSGAARAWRAMTFENQCGFKNKKIHNVDRGDFGMALNCDDMCEFIKIGSSSSNLNEDVFNIIEEFLKLVDIEFDKGVAWDAQMCKDQRDLLYNAIAPLEPILNPWKNGKPSKIFKGLPRQYQVDPAVVIAG